MSDLLPIVPDRSTPIALDTLEQIERDVAERLSGVSDVGALDDWRAQAAALEVYLRNRNLQGPMLGSQRRIEARIGQLVAYHGKQTDGGSHDVNDRIVAEFQLMALGLTGAVRVAWEEWRQSRRALVSLIRKRLPDGMSGEMVFAQEPELPPGQFRCIVIDPPWPVERVEQQRRPLQQAELDYPTMQIDEIDSLVGDALAEKAAPDGCHVYLWTTHKFLPDALRMYAGWGARYQCLLTWVKPTGVSPFSWMYDTEHALFGRIGALPLEQMGLRLAIQAPATRGHSVKPDLFYERVIQASPGPRLDMFGRRERDGFTVWGNEIAA